MRPVKPPIVKKRKRSSSSSSSSSEDVATKRNKHVTTAVAVPVVTAGTGGHAVITPPPVVAFVPPALPPHQIVRNGRGPHAVTDAVFNAPHPINYPPLNVAVTAVVNDRKSKRKSENLGEEGSIAYLQEHIGYGVGLHHANPTDPHLLAATPGQSWSHAVAFNGPGVADVTMWDGNQLHVIEAKGGGSQLGVRNQANFHAPTNGQVVMNEAKPAWQNSAGTKANLQTALTNKDGTWKNFNAGDKIPNAVKQYRPRSLSQGTQPYLTDIAHAMRNSPKTDGRAVVGQAILDQGNNVHYQPVNTKVDDKGAVHVLTMNPQ